MLLGFRWHSLRAKILAWSLIPTIIILTLVALAGFSAYQQVTEDLVIERSRELGRRTAGQLASELGDYAADLQSVARMANLAADDPGAQREALSQAANRLVVFDAGTVLLDHHGVVVGAQPNRPDLIGQDWSNRSYFQQMVRSLGPALSDVAGDGPGGVPVIVLAVPVTGPRGEFAGTLAGMFRLGASNISSFYATIAKLRIGANDDAFLNAYLVDGTGRVIYHTNSDRIGQDFNMERAVRQVLAGQSNALRTRDRDGRNIVASFAPVPGVSWGLVTEVSWDELLKVRQGYFQVFILLLVLGVVIPAIVVAAGVGRITRPIVQLTEAARRVAGGDLTQTVPAETGDELEDLAKQFNLMSADLAESYAQLQERQERLELVARGTDDGFWDWNLRTGQIYFSPRWKSMLGYDESEVPDRFDTWREMIHPDDIQNVTATLRAYLDGQIPIYRVEHRMRHKDGSFRWILARGIALRDAQGVAYRMAGAHTDLTERKRTEEEARRQNEYLAALHETTLGVVGRLDVTELLVAIVERSVKLIGADYGWVYLVTPEKDAIQVAVGTGPFHPYVGQRLKPNEGLAGKVWQVGHWLAVQDYSRWDGRSLLYEKDPIGPAMGLPLKSGSEVVGVAGLVRPPDAPAFRQEEIDLMSRLAQLASIALENARLHTSLQIELAERAHAEEALQAAYQTLEQRVEERTHELAALNAIAAVVSRSLDLREILGDALAKTLELMHMDLGLAFRLVEHDGELPGEQSLRLFAHRGVSDEFRSHVSLLPLRGSMIERAVGLASPYVWCAEDYPNPDMKEANLREGIELGISVPLLVKGQLIGALCLGAHQMRTVSAEEISLLAAVGQQVGLAVENARLYEQAEQSAAMAERTRLARELHDSVTQSLYSVTLYAEAAARLLTSGEHGAAAAHLRELRDTAQEALREMRLLIFELRPPALEKSGLLAVIQARLEAVEGRGGIQTELCVQDAPELERLPLMIQEELYQVAREALNNVLKHANAQHVEVHVGYQAGVGGRLEVFDDGTGFDPDEPREGGRLGLPGMHERAQRIGASLCVESAPGEGTRITLSLPRRFPERLFT